MEALNVLYVADVACVASCHVYCYNISVAGLQWVRVAMTCIAYGGVSWQFFWDFLLAAVTGIACDVGGCICYVQTVDFSPMAGSAVVAAIHMLCQVFQMYMAEFAVYCLFRYRFEYWYLNFFSDSIFLRLEGICCFCKVDKTHSKEYASK